MLLHEEASLRERLANIPAEKTRSRSNACASAGGIRHGTSAAQVHTEVVTEVILNAASAQQALAEIAVKEKNSSAPAEQANNEIASEGLIGPPRGMQPMPNKPSVEQAEHAAELADVPAWEALSEVATQGAVVSSRQDELHEGHQTPSVTLQAGVHADSCGSVVDNRTVTGSAVGGNKLMYAPLRAALVPASGLLAGSHLGQAPESLQHPIETL